MLSGLSKLSEGGLSPEVYLLGTYAMVASGVIVVLWRAVAKKDKRLTFTHDRQTEAFKENIAVLSQVKTLMQMLLSERRG